MSRIYAEVFGCSANTADYEMALGLLLESGHEAVDDAGVADLLMVFTCTVKTPTEQHMIRRLRELGRLGKPLVVAGCMPKVQRALIEQTVPDACMLGPDSLRDVLRVVDEALSGSKICVADAERIAKTGFPRHRINPLIHVAPIASGCPGDCSYCIVKLVKGSAFSYPLEDIARDASEAISSGAREIWVTAQDTGAYQYNGHHLPDLLHALCQIPGEFLIRVGMMNPDTSRNVLDDLRKSFAHDKVFKFLHVPVQSGNDETLVRMNRRYSVNDFMDLIDAFREKIPEVTISTDIICGFPGETEAQFLDSAKLVEEVRPDVLNISRFGPRPGTSAAQLKDQLPGWEVKRRSRLLSKMWRRISLERNRRWVGWRGRVLVDEKGLKGGWIGRNYAYKPFVLREEHSLGSFVNVEASEAFPQYLLGRAVEHRMTSLSGAKMFPNSPNTGSGRGGLSCQLSLF